MPEFVKKTSELIVGSGRTAMAEVAGNWGL